MYFNIFMEFSSIYSKYCTYTPQISVQGDTTISTLMITPEPGDDKSAMVCKASSTNLSGTVLQDNITLRVHCKYVLCIFRVTIL